MDWVYKATDLRTGRVIADRIRGFAPGTLTRARGDEAAGDGTLSLDGNSEMVSRLVPKRTVLWAVGDGTPYWSGVFWDDSHSSAAAGALPMSFKTLESVFAYREIRDNLTYGNNDQFDIIRSLFKYALAKTGGEIANIVMDNSLSTVLRQRSYLASDRTKVLDAAKDLGNVINGFEWTFTPTWVDYTGGTLGWRLQLGYPTLGTADAAGRILRYPGNLTDYAWPRTTSQSANSTVAVGDANNNSTVAMQSTSAHGFEAAEIAAGFPLMEESISYAGQGITDVNTLNDHADDDVNRLSGILVNPTFTLSLDKAPGLARINIGDTLPYWLQSARHPTPAQGTIRVAKIDIRPTVPGTAIIYADSVVEHVS
jgi:hypothetical protein